MHGTEQGTEGEGIIITEVHGAFGKEAAELLAALKVLDPAVQQALCVVVIWRAGREETLLDDQEVVVE